MPLKISDLKPKTEAQRDIQKDRLEQAVVLERAADKLQECVELWGMGNHKERLLNALDYNAGLWNMLCSDIELNQELPSELRENLLKLGFFIKKRILEIDDAPSPTAQQLEIIIKINRNLAAGLRGIPTD